MANEHKVALFHITITSGEDGFKTARTAVDAPIVGCQVGEHTDGDAALRICKSRTLRRLADYISGGGALPPELDALMFSTEIK